jgi:ubiquinone/menaquinone biosynthesis C-methylase UbiE
MAPPDPYFLGCRQAELARLQDQAQQLAEEARWLFDQLDLPHGARVIELGCGPQGCLDLLAERVGPQGTVVGLERSEEAVQLARQFVADHHLGNVEVLHGDARATGLPRASFDLATARLVLVNVPEPEQIVAEMVALVRPGGVVALHEADSVTNLCDPPLPAWSRLMEARETYARMHGIDSFVGRRVPRLLRAAGLVEVQTQPRIHVYPPGHGRRMLHVQFAENLRERLLAFGLLAEAELTDLVEAVTRHLEDPDTLVVSHLYFQVWGRKPEG